MLSEIRFVSVIEELKTTRSDEILGCNFPSPFHSFEADRFFRELGEKREITRKKSRSDNELFFNLFLYASPTR